MRNLLRFLNRPISWLYTRLLFGSRCSDYEKLCPSCGAWKEHDELFYSSKTMSDIIKGLDVAKYLEVRRDERAICDAEYAEEITKLRERCEAYKGQVQNGEKMITKLRGENECSKPILETALRTIDTIREQNEALREQLNKAIIDLNYNLMPDPSKQTQPAGDTRTSDKLGQPSGVKP